MVNQTKSKTGTPPITWELLHAKPLPELRKAYHTLSDKDGNNLSRQQLEDFIYRELNPQLFKKVNTKMTEKTTFTPKEIAKQHGISPTALRRILRKNFKKPEGGNWSLPASDVDKLLKLYKEEKARAAESRSHNIERLKAAREAKKAAQAKAPATATTKAPAKAPAKSAKPAK